MLDLAECYFYEEDNLQAKKYCKEAISLNDQFDLAYEKLGEIAEKTEDIGAELNYASDALRLSPGSPINHANYALALEKNKDFKRAAKHARIALEMYPKFSEYEDFIALVKTLTKAGHWEGEK